MSLEQKVTEGIKKAMLDRDEKTLRSLRAIKSAILSEKTSVGFSGNITEADEIKMLQKMVKQRRDSQEIFEKQGREDLAAREREELEVITSFLPAQLSEAEVKAAVSEIIRQTGASSMTDMGKVMGVANKQLAGKAEGKMIASAVKELLGAQ